MLEEFFDMSLITNMSMTNRILMFFVFFSYPIVSHFGGYSESAGAYPGFMWAKAENIPGGVISLSQDHLSIGDLVPCSRVSLK